VLDSSRNSCSKNTIFLYKTLINWVFNESVGFSAFNFAACMTNFVAAGSHLKNRSLKGKLRVGVKKLETYNNNIICEPLTTLEAGF